jgi:hypothetical protein
MIRSPSAAPARVVYTGGPSGRLGDPQDTSRYHRAMPQPRSWEVMRRQIAGILLRRTGMGVDAWNARIADRKPTDEPELRRG